MKISKLFHWLYAILMFLPIMVFIPNAFYYGFNEHAVAQEKTEQVPVYYETNEINTIDDFIIGNIYTVKYSNNLNNNFLIYCDDIYIISYSNHSGYNRENEVLLNRLYHVSSNNYIDVTYANEFYTNSYSIWTIDFVLNSINSIDNIQYFSKCERQYLKEYTPITTNMSITDSMSYAWDSTWQNDLFSWSYDSFLTQPFLYITNLFNVPSTNTLLYCLSYWLNISIIWLVFDVVLYVPLLVHRWLDKGIVE